MYLSGLHIGFTTQDLRTMPLQRLSMFIGEYNDANSVSDDGGENSGDRVATQNDIQTMLVM